MTGYLDAIGFLGPNVSCGHGVWYSERDIELLVAHGVATVHNPSSNLRLASGIAPVAAQTETASSSDCLNISVNTEHAPQLNAAVSICTQVLGRNDLSPKTRTRSSGATAGKFGRARSSRCGRVAHCDCSSGQTSTTP
jgi:hypothetical protein